MAYKSAIRQAPVLQLANAVGDEGLKEALRGIEVLETDFSDFVKCFKIIELTTEGATVTDACRDVGITPHTFYSPRWRELSSKARQVVAARLITTSVDPAANLVFENWPDIIKSMINVALNGGKDHEKVAAAELLYNIYVKNTQKEDQDATPAADYLKKPKNFNPMQPIVNVTVQMPQENIIDVTPHEEAVEPSPSSADDT